MDGNGIVDDLSPFRILGHLLSFGYFLSLVLDGWDGSGFLWLTGLDKSRGGSFDVTGVALFLATFFACMYCHL
jgi:hypothetical protein